MAPPEADGGPFVAVAFNVWSGRSPKSVREDLNRLVRDVAARVGQKPHVLLLQEAKRFAGSIKGYERVVPNGGPHPDTDNCLILVRADVEVRRERTLRGGDEDWIVVKHGVTHPPRLWPAPTLVVGGQAWDVANIHRVPSRNVNDEAWESEHEAIVRWADRRQQRTPNRPLVPGGDWNGRANDPRPLSVGDLAKQIDATARLKGIDGFLTRGCTGRAFEMDDRYGSDTHNPVVAVLEIGALGTDGQK